MMIMNKGYYEKDDTEYLLDGTEHNTTTLAAKRKCGHINGDDCFERKEAASKRDKLSIKLSK